MNLHLPDPPAAPARRRPQNLCHSLLVVARCSLFPGAPGFVSSRPAGTRCPPRFRVIRLESLPRARRGGPSHPARKPNRLAIADTRRTHKSVCPLLPECAGIQYSLVISHNVRRQSHPCCISGHSPRRISAIVKPPEGAGNML